VAAPPLDSLCDGPVTYPGDTKILVKSSKERIFFSSEYFHYKTFIHENCLENENDKFQENLSRPGIIDARARYWAAARPLRNTALNSTSDIQVTKQIILIAVSQLNVIFSRLLITNDQCATV